MIEHTDVESGGPPRHLHHRQDEWFYILEGEYVIEVGLQTHRLSPGDSLLAPRGVPHVWAYTRGSEVEKTRGRLLIGFRPAGEMESFFTELADLEAPEPETLRRLFAAHGMELLGPPLDVHQPRP